VAGGTKILHNEDLHNSCSSPIKIRIIKSRRMRWAGQLACIAQNKTAYRVSVLKAEGKSPLRRHR
jgi:hypothetical protein